MVGMMDDSIKPSEDLIALQMGRLTDVDLLPCPLCGVQNESGGYSPIYAAVVTGTLREDRSDFPSQTFGACQMVRCRVCNCMVISPTKAAEKWNELRGRYGR